MTPRLATRIAMLVRSLAVQGSWNYRTLIGTGFAFALLPALRRIYAGDPAALDAAALRHATLFNTHPYLVGIALGAVARLEAERESPVVIERFKTAVRGSLGGLGDRLFWAGWKPVCVLVALVLLLGGTPWWLAVAGFLLLYNVGHLSVRIWGLHIGFQSGKEVGESVRRSHVARAQRPITAAGAFLLGLLLPLLATDGGMPIQPSPAWALAAGLAGLVGVRLGPAIQRPAILTTAAVVLLLLALGSQ